MAPSSAIVSGRSCLGCWGGAVSLTPASGVWRTELTMAASLGTDIGTFNLADPGRVQSQGRRTWKGRSRRGGGRRGGPRARPTPANGQFCSCGWVISLLCLSFSICKGGCIPLDPICQSSVGLPQNCTLRLRASGELQSHPWVTVGKGGGVRCGGASQ